MLASISSVLLMENYFLSLFSLVDSYKINYEMLNHFPVYFTTKWRTLPIMILKKKWIFLNDFIDSEDEIDLDGFEINEFINIMEILPETEMDHVERDDAIVYNEDFKWDTVN